MLRRNIHAFILLNIIYNWSVNRYGDMHKFLYQMQLNRLLKVLKYVIKKIYQLRLVISSDMYQNRVS